MHLGRQAFLCKEVGVQSMQNLLHSHNTVLSFSHALQIKLLHITYQSEHLCPAPSCWQLK